MEELTARTPGQLDKCLRLLYGEHKIFYVNIHETDKGKIYYGIAVDADPETFVRLKEKYRIMIS